MDLGTFQGQLTGKNDTEMLDIFTDLMCTCGLKRGMHLSLNLRFREDLKKVPAFVGQSLCTKDAGVVCALFKNRWGAWGTCGRSLSRLSDNSFEELITIGPLSSVPALPAMWGKVAGDWS